MIIVFNLLVMYINIEMTINNNLFSKRIRLIIIEISIKILAIVKLIKNKTYYNKTIMKNLK